MRFEDVNRVLRQMEQLRHDAMEAETVAEERRLDREYGRLYRVIEPYLNGTEPYTEANPQPAREGEPL